MVDSPELFGYPLKYISLVSLALQNASLSVCMAYSRQFSSSSVAYSAATAVLVNELLKLSISTGIAFYRTSAEPSSGATGLLPEKGNQVRSDASAGWSQREIQIRVRNLLSEVFSSDSWKLAVPAILYVVQNNLQYVAASHLNVATFSVLYQMKILTTAGFSVTILKKRLAQKQWLALVLLAVGVGAVQLQSIRASPSTSTSTSTSSDSKHMDPLTGFLAVLAACFTSGLAGVYFEFVLKGTQADLWVRNVQLSSFSLIPAVFPIIIDLLTTTSPVQLGLAQSWFNKMFAGFTGWAWATILIQVLGGLLTAMVIKYADNILKGFATSLSILIAFAASVFLFGSVVTPGFLFGSVLVVSSTVMYATSEPMATSPSAQAQLDRNDSQVDGVSDEESLLGQQIELDDKRPL
ncbi:Predicted UDP-galactose transporter [Phaffia rhodozyma]|uniref:Predicted UDP-galactose transporter n=1 Tax=Phaffia rhodozyma TaxID=264483 RepID=A0A0F7SRX5_PHARH|nr:Predicted UDP-galactose transporter [Phaffia rhodozyma]